MSEISSRIDNLLTDKKIKKVDLARSIDIPVTTIKGWIQGRVPSADAAVKVAKYFDVSVEWLVTGKETDNQKEINISNEEMKLIQIFRNLNEADKNAVLTLATALESQYSVSEQKSITGA